MGMNQHDLIIKNKNQSVRLGEIRNNKLGQSMKIIKYTNGKNIEVSFIDNPEVIIQTTYQKFRDGAIKNPMAKGKYGQITGNKYPTRINGKHTKEYSVWMKILCRVFDPESTDRNFRYRKVNICEEWLYYPNFYEWIHQEPNYIKWLESEEWCIDKDIFSDYDNKIYSPDTCCLVPRYVNAVIQKWEEAKRDKDLPLGVTRNGNGYTVKHNLSGKTYFRSLEEAEKAYKEYKTKKIQEAAEKAYSNNDITERCYKALMNYDYFRKSVNC